MSPVFEASLQPEITSSKPINMKKKRYDFMQGVLFEMVREFANAKNKGGSIYINYEVSLLNLYASRV
jgi:hypothetical protein